MRTFLQACIVPSSKTFQTLFHFQYEIFPYAAPPYSMYFAQVYWFHRKHESKQKIYFTTNTKVAYQSWNLVHTKFSPGLCKPCQKYVNRNTMYLSQFAKNKNPPLSSYSTTPYSNIPHRLHSFSITNQHLRIFFKTPLISQCQHILTAEQIFKLKLNKFFHSSCSNFCFLVFCILCSFTIVLVLFFMSPCAKSCQKIPEKL